jgi:1-acyl-sn-glycerol-3-phosphate acyltransferase
VEVRGRVAEWVYRPVIGAALTAFHALDVRFTLTRTENIPREGGAVLAINHVSYLDFMFAGLAARKSGRLTRFMAKQPVFDHRIGGPLMRGMRHIPVDRSAGADAYAAAIEALRSGEVIGVFPEQTISRSFTMRPFKSGAARLAIEAGVPLIPVVTWGGQRLWTSGRRLKFRRHVPVTVSVGTPIQPAAGETADALTARLRAEMADLLDIAQREYVDAGDGKGAWWQPHHLGGVAPTAAEAAEIEANRITRPQDQ